MKRSNVMVQAGLALASCLSLQAFAADAPECLLKGQPLPVNNAEVSALKAKYYKNGGYVLGRAHIKGVISKAYEEFHRVTPYKMPNGNIELAKLARYDQQYLKVIIDTLNGGKDTVTVYYNEEFGPLKEVTTKQLEGKAIEVCGVLAVPVRESLITPDNAIVHWTHENPNPHGIESGYLIIDGEVFGQISSARKR
jgi:hypothetical protein